jgi:hypothetical protein
MTVVIVRRSDERDSPKRMTVAERSAVAISRVCEHPSRHRRTNAKPVFLTVESIPTACTKGSHP